MARSHQPEGLIPAPEVVPTNWPNVKARKVEHPGGGEVMTKQDQRDSTDINLIIEQFKATGRVGQAIAKAPMYGDFSAARSLTEALELVAEAGNAFANLDPRIREAAGNDPVTFLNMMADEGGRTILEAAGATIATPATGGDTPPAKPDQGAPPAPPVAPAPPVS